MPNAECCNDRTGPNGANAGNIPAHQAPECQVDTSIGRTTPPPPARSRDVGLDKWTNFATIAVRAVEVFIVTQHTTMSINIYSRALSDVDSLQRSIVPDYHVTITTQKLLGIGVALDSSRVGRPTAPNMTGRLNGPT